MLLSWILLWVFIQEVGAKNGSDEARNHFPSRFVPNISGCGGSGCALIVNPPGHRSLDEGLSEMVIGSQRIAFGLNLQETPNLPQPKQCVLSSRSLRQHLAASRSFVGLDARDKFSSRSCSRSGWFEAN